MPVFRDESSVLFAEADLLFPFVSGNTLGMDSTSRGPPMAANDEGRDRARRRINEELAKIPMSPTDLSRKAGVDPDTVADFLSGRRWPQVGNRHKIAVALNWTPESIELIVGGGEPVVAGAETVGADDQDAGVLASLPPEALEGLDAAERAEVIAAAKLSALQTAREIRRRLDQ
jgi:lambda repressor-like predicted transcriptional regulator